MYHSLQDQKNSQACSLLTCQLHPIWRNISSERLGWNRCNLGDWHRVAGILWRHQWNLMLQGRSSQESRNLLAHNLGEISKDNKFYVFCFKKSSFSCALQYMLCFTLHAYSLYCLYILWICICITRVWINAVGRPWLVVDIFIPVSDGASSLQVAGLVPRQREVPAPREGPALVPAILLGGNILHCSQVV